MQKYIAVLGALALATAASSAPLAAQSRSSISSADLSAAVVTSATRDQADVQRFLQSDAATEAAGQLGVTTSVLATLVRTLDDATLGQLAERTRAADRALAGGDSTVVISTTAIIIGLLILILVLK